MDHPEQNPYAAPAYVTDNAVEAWPEDRRIRNLHIEIELQVLWVGWLMALGGSVGALIAVPLMFLGDVPDFLMGLTFFFLMAAQIVIGAGLLLLRRWALFPAMIDCALWLLFFPFGTVIAMASLWFLSRDRVAFVLTDQYRSVIDRTPDIRYRTPRNAWIFVFLAFLALVLLIFLLMGVG